jgi:hypothetical protein
MIIYYMYHYNHNGGNDIDHDMDMDMEVEVYLHFPSSQQWRGADSIDGDIFNSINHVNSTILNIPMDSILFCQSDLRIASALASL